MLHIHPDFRRERATAMAVLIGSQLVMLADWQIFLERDGNGRDPVFQA